MEAALTDEKNEEVCSNVKQQLVMFRNAAR
jgi:hypothetical protein